MIKIHFSPSAQTRVGYLRLELPFEHAELLAEFENENWINPATTNKIGEDLWGEQRAKCMRPKQENKNLMSLFEYFRSNELKRTFIDFLYQASPMLKNDWEWTPEDMFASTDLHGHFVKDYPGFVNVLHTDYRRLVGTAMIYFNDRDNPDSSSWFYNSIHRDNPMRMPTGFGVGWIHSNGNDTWHEGWNRTDQMRYSALLGLTLDMGLKNIPKGGMFQDSKSAATKS